VQPSQRVIRMKKATHNVVCLLVILVDGVSWAKSYRIALGTVPTWRLVVAGAKITATHVPWRSYETVTSEAVFMFSQHWTSVYATVEQGGSN
jgi:hypothetical protein